MTTKEQILALAVEHHVCAMPFYSAAALEAFYHAARKDLEFERDVQKADIAFLIKQLAAAQAREQQYRDRIEKLYRLCNLNEPCGRMAACEIGEALTQPTDTTALEAMIAKSGEVMRERCERIPDRVPIRVGNNGIWGIEVFKEIRALPGVTLADLKGAE